MPTGSWPSPDGRRSQSISAAGSPNSKLIDVLSSFDGALRSMQWKVFRKVSLNNEIVLLFYRRRRNFISEGCT